MKMGSSIRVIEESSLSIPILYSNVVLNVSVSD